MLRDQQIQLLAKVVDDDFAEKLFQQLTKEYPDCLPLMLAQLKRLTSVKEGGADAEKVERFVFSISNLFINLPKFWF